MQKTSRVKFRIEKVLKRKGDKLCVKWKGYDSRFNSWIDLEWNFLNEKSHIKWSQYFPKLFRGFGRNINVKVDLSNFATKTDLKKITHIDTSSFALKTSLASLKTEVDKLGIEKLVLVPDDLKVNWVI